MRLIPLRRLQCAVRGPARAVDRTMPPSPRLRWPCNDHRMEKFDVIVVGARCAGGPTAMLLAQHGLRVLLADRAPFGSDCVSTHYIHQIGIAKLREWGLIDRLVATGCPPVNEVQVRAGPESIGSLFLGFGQTGPAYCPRRTVLDRLLVTAAQEAGAVFRDRFKVEGLIWLNDRVTGVRGR